MTRYTELRHAGYYAEGLTDKEREEIAGRVDGAAPRTSAPKGSTLSSTYVEGKKVAQSVKAAKGKRSSK